MCVTGASYFVDAMSSFGAIPLDFAGGSVDYMVSSANKCIEGVPGFAYAIARQEKLHSCKGESSSNSRSRNMTYGLVSKDSRCVPGYSKITLNIYDLFSVI